MLKIENLSYRYQSRKDFTLKEINLKIAQGEMLLLAGRSGCGKSTLIKAVSGLLCTKSKDNFKGKIYFNNVDITNYSPDKIGLLAGCVYQSPDDQLFAMTVADEVGFALENQGLDNNYIRQEVNKILQLVELDGFADYSIHKLSGGQRQRLALAAILITKPQLLILDEPVSQMNPQGVHKFMQLLQRLNKQEGIAILMIEHRVNELYQYFSRIAVMDAGKIVYDGDINEVWYILNSCQNFGIREPQIIKLARGLNLEVLTTHIEEFTKIFQEKYMINTGLKHKNNLCHLKNIDLLRICNLFFKYPQATNYTLKNINFSLHQGEILALMGFNGAGKSTLMDILGGLTSDYEGEIYFQGYLAANLRYLRQEPDLMLLADSVKEELCWNNNKLTTNDLESLLRKLNLQGYESDFPLALSKGQRLRVVLGAMLAQNPQILLLDEPTTGQDEQSLQEIKKLLLNYRQQGGSVIICTHDMELAAEIADRIMVIAQGEILGNDSAEKIFGNDELLFKSGLTAPSILEICKSLKIPPCITVKEVLNYVSQTTMGRK